MAEIHLCTHACVRIQAAPIRPHTQENSETQMPESRRGRVSTHARMRPSPFHHHHKALPFSSPPPITPLVDAHHLPARSQPPPEMPKESASIGMDESSILKLVRSPPSVELIPSCPQTSHPIPACTSLHQPAPARTSLHQPAFLWSVRLTASPVFTHPDVGSLPAIKHQK